MSQTASLREIAASANIPPDDVIEAVLERIDTSDDRTRFLRGLTQRFYAVSAEPSDHNVFEINRWVGSWMLSLRLLDDPTFVAADDEASKLLAAGKLGGGLSSSELRGRYGR